METRHSHPHWDWFAVAIGALLLGLSGLSPSPVAFAGGTALFTAGLIASLLGPYMQRREDLASLADSIPRPED